MRDRELRINKLAQELEPVENGLSWFRENTQDERQKIMHSLDLCIFQSHPTKEDIQKGIDKSGLKETFSPCVLVLKKPFNHARKKALDMRGLDQERAFELFLNIFSVADQRRRETQCISGCSHDWHNLQTL